MPEKAWLTTGMVRCHPTSDCARDAATAYIGHVHPHGLLVPERAPAGGVDAAKRLCNGRRARRHCAAALDTLERKLDVFFDTACRAVLVVHVHERIADEPADAAFVLALDAREHLLNAQLAVADPWVARQRPSCLCNLHGAERPAETPRYGCVRIVVGACRGGERRES